MTAVLATAGRSAAAAMAEAGCLPLAQKLYDKMVCRGFQTVKVLFLRSAAQRRLSLSLTFRAATVAVAIDVPRSDSCGCP
jgi:hypothetical protein